MGTAYIDVTITAFEGPVFMFEVECVAEVEYQLSKRDGIDGWHVSNLRFDKFTREWDDTTGTWNKKRVAEAWASKTLFNVLLPYIDQTEIEDRLTDLLLSTGELSYAGADMRADYAARVL